MTIRPMSPAHAAELCEWRYEAPFHIYNWPLWADMQKDGIEYGDPVLREQQYASILDEHGMFIGFAQFFPLGNVTRLGLGLKPELCGLGIGTMLVTVIAEEARRRAPGNEIDLEVFVWNERAIRAYERAGFRIEDTYSRPTPYGPSECHCMVLRSI